MSERAIRERSAGTLAGLGALLLVSVVGCEGAPRGAPALEAGEGRIEVPGGEVYYRVEAAAGTEGATPLLLLHGGPGATSHYLDPLGPLSADRPVVFYDQLGSGRSARPAADSLWRIPRFVEELRRVREALGLERIHLLGHSWGAMLAIEYLLTDPPEVEGAILASMTPSIEQWLADAEERVATLPDSTRAVIRRHEEAGTTDSPEYQGAVMQFYRLYLSRSDPWPPVLDSTFAQFGYPVYHTMWGPSEFTATGRLKEWDARDRLGGIEIPVLVTVGDHDEMSIESARDMVSRLPAARLEVIEGAAHLTMVDQPEANIRVIREFLAELEGR